MRLSWSACAHEGGVCVVRGARGGALLLSGGADRWARVWRAGGGARGGGEVVRALPAPGRQLTALGELGGGLLALGSLDGNLSVWRIGGDGGEGEDELDVSLPGICQALSFFFLRNLRRLTSFLFTLP